MNKIAFENEPAVDLVNENEELSQDQESWNGLHFCVAHKYGQTYARVTPWARCQEFLTDQVVYHLGIDKKSVYGWRAYEEVNYQDIKLEDVAIGIASPTTTAAHPIRDNIPMFEFAAAAMSMLLGDSVATWEPRGISATFSGDYPMDSWGDREYDDLFGRAFLPPIKMWEENLYWSLYMKLLRMFEWDMDSKMVAEFIETRDEEVFHHCLKSATKMTGRGHADRALVQALSSQSTEEVRELIEKKRQDPSMRGIMNVECSHTRHEWGVVEAIRVKSY